MNIEFFRDYCLAKKAVTESFPFNKKTLVFKVAEKMFALTSLEGDFKVNLKCNPEKALTLREEHSCIIPGYHMNKQHWNTVIIDGSLSDNFILKLIDHSYDLIVQSLPKKVKENFKL